MVPLQVRRLEEGPLPGGLGAGWGSEAGNQLFEMSCLCWWRDMQVEIFKEQLKTSLCQGRKVQQKGMSRANFLGVGAGEINAIYGFDKNNRVLEKKPS